MKTSAFFIGIALLFVPIGAEGAGLFESIFDSARQIQATVYPVGKMQEYIIEEMRHWNESGVQLTQDDIVSAVDGNITKLCTGKMTPAGQPILFDVGASLSVGGSCKGLQNAILTLIENEQVSDQLGQDLLAIANGSELAIADEGTRPVNMSRIALLLRRVWAGMDAGITPWDGTADAEVATLNSALASESDLHRTVLRFRYGFFRDQREGDQSLAGIGDPVGTALQAVATKLGVMGDQTATGEFATPGLSVENVGFWMRGDDIGLYWTTPTSFDYPKIERAGRYPSIPLGGEMLGNPFSAVGFIPNASTLTPLCSRTVARHGYLCRPLPPNAPMCKDPDDPQKITLVQCGGDRETTHDFGPDICAGMENLFNDDGTPLIDPLNPGRLNPALVQADTEKICTPETRVLYQDDISSHACYVGHCIEQSLNGHSLVPERNTVLVQEATSPYLACLREDPKLGLYTEVAGNAPYPLPPYIGHLLLRDYEARFCLLNNKAPYPISMLCSYRAEQNAEHPATEQIYQGSNVTKELIDVGASQNGFLELATIIGQRAVLDQSMEVNQKVFSGLAIFVQQIADLLQELSRAPLTTTACPWTGPFPTAPSP